MQTETLNMQLQLKDVARCENVTTATIHYYQKISQTKKGLHKQGKLHLPFNRIN